MAQRPKTKYMHNGREVDGQEINFTTQGEQWNMYDLEDGSALKVKTVMMEVVRLDTHNENGDPIYLLKAQQVIAVLPNPALKKKVN